MSISNPPAAKLERSDSRFLGEMLVNDLHWSLMHVATLALAIEAAVERFQPPSVAALAGLAQRR